MPDTVTAPPDDYAPIIRPILTVGPSFKRWVLGLSVVVAWAAIAYVWQLWYGLGATGLGESPHVLTNFH